MLHDEGWYCWVLGAKWKQGAMLNFVFLCEIDVALILKYPVDRMMLYC